MGSQYSVEADQDSPTQPGEKSVLSTELPISSGDLKDGIMEFLRDPVSREPQLLYSLKAVEFADESDSGYTVKVILDGKKLDGFGVGKGDGTDRVHIWMKIAYDKATQTVTTVNLVPGFPQPGAWEGEIPEGKTFLQTYTRILEDPVRVEYWWAFEGNRVAGQPVADAFKTYLDPIVHLYQTRSVRFEPDQDSVAEKGKKCVTSNPLDELVSFDNLWAVMTDWRKVPGNEDKDIQEISPTEVLVTGEGGVEPPGGIKKIEFDKETGRIVHERIEAGKTKEIHYTYVRRDPLVIEYYMEGENHNVFHGKRIALAMAGVFDQAIQKANSWF